MDVWQWLSQTASQNWRRTQFTLFSEVNQLRDTSIDTEDECVVIGDDEKITWMKCLATPPKTVMHDIYSNIQHGEMPNEQTGMAPPLAFDSSCSCNWLH